MGSFNEKNLVDYMARRKKRNPDDPKLLNFDHDEKNGPSDHSEKPFMTPEDARGDAEDDQYYEEEETLSPEETEDRKKEGDL